MWETLQGRTRCVALGLNSFSSINQTLEPERASRSALRGKNETRWKRELWPVLWSWKLSEPHFPLPGVARLCLGPHVHFVSEAFVFEMQNRSRPSFPNCFQLQPFCHCLNLHALCKPKGIRCLNIALVPITLITLEFYSPYCRIAVCSSWAGQCQGAVLCHSPHVLSQLSL